MCTAFFEGSWSPPNWGIVKFLLGFVILWHSVTPGSSGCCSLTLSFSLSEDRTSPSWMQWVDKLSSLLRTTLMLLTVLPSHLAGGLSLWMPMIKQMRWVHAFLFFFFVCRQQPLVSKNSPFLLAVRLQLVIRTKLSDLTLFTVIWPYLLYLEPCHITQKKVDCFFCCLYEPKMYSCNSDLMISLEMLPY